MKATADEEAGHTRLTLRLPAELHDAVQTLAGVQGLSVTKYTERALRRQVKADAGTPELREQLVARLEAAAEHGG